MSEVIWSNPDGSMSFTVESMEVSVIGDCYVLTLKGGEEELQIMFDEDGVREHNTITMEFIKGWTYGRINGRNIH